MNRGGAAILTLAILFSIYVSPGNQAGSPGRVLGVRESTVPETSTSPPPTSFPLICGAECSPKYSDEFVNTLKKSLDSTGAEGEKLRVFLAIVPDPVHTHLALFFDRQIDAIEQAAQDNGYLFDRAIMPWDYEEHPEPTDFHLRLLEKLYRSASEKEPGLMVFRAAPHGEDGSAMNEEVSGPLIVLVIAETPRPAESTRTNFKGRLRSSVALHHPKRGSRSWGPHSPAR
jgi:hypothetical protein